MGGMLTSNICGGNSLVVLHKVNIYSIGELEPIRIFFFFRTFIIDGTNVDQII